MNFKNIALCTACASVSGLVNIEVQAEQSNQQSTIEEVLVIAHPLSGEGLSQASTVLSGKELERKLAANIGATLGREPGIRSAQFGNAVGRPVIHGLGGPRVRIMEDRIDALDVSVTSADHAVTIEPFIADRIEVLKGSSTLLYGPGAIGGVVDVHTGRIPHDLSDAGINGGIETRFDNNTNGQSISGKLNGSVGKFAWHLDATDKDGDDYDIPGFAESARLRAAEEAEAMPGDDEEEEVRGTLPGSGFDVSSYAVGGSYIADWGFVGLAVSEFDAEYGLPGGHEEEEDGAPADPNVILAPTPSLDMEQTRTDFELGVENPWSGFSSFNLRVGYNDYEHVEIEPDGVVASTFTNEAWELRAEAVYEQSNWDGALGVQYMDREFSAVGEEAFVPPVDTQDVGLFWLGQREFDGFSLETGVRVGKVSHDPSEGSSEDFTTFATSLGAVVPLQGDWQLGLLVDYSSRAPVAEELFSDGPHLVTGLFELGDPTLDSEKAINLSATIQRDAGPWSLSATAYYTRFSDFIFEQATGDIEDGLPVFLFQQEDADFVGIDFSASADLVEADWGKAGVSAQFDFVNATLDVSGNDNLPRIPPMRYGLGAFVQYHLFRFSVDYTRSSEQDDVSEREFVTDAYNDLQVYAGVDIPWEDASIELFLSGKNLTDDEQRQHTSFIKEFAPAPGRTVEAGLRVRF